MALSDEELLAAYAAVYGAAPSDAHVKALQAVARAVAADCANMLNDLDIAPEKRELLLPNYAYGHGVGLRHAATKIRAAYGVTE